MVCTLNVVTCYLLVLIDVVYVNLLDNPERFTGYAGESAGRVWKAIYEENCFNIVHRMTKGCDTCNNIMNIGHQQSPLNSAEALDDARRHPDFATVPHSKAQFKQLLNDLAESPDGSAGGEEVCLEKRVYYRLISGKEHKKHVYAWNLSAYNTQQDSIPRYPFTFVTNGSTRRLALG